MALECRSQSTNMTVFKSILCKKYNLNYVHLLKRQIWNNLNSVKKKKTCTHGSSTFFQKKQNLVWKFRLNLVNCQQEHYGSMKNKGNTNYYIRR
jgi:hypothetical protein